MNGKLFVIVPCFNEEDCISGTLEELRNDLPEAQIVAVNDGSSDRTLSCLRQIEDPNLTVLDLPFNSGIGVAVQTGLRYAAAQGADYAVKFDADGQHPAEAIPGMLNELDRGTADLIIGSRFLEKEGFQSTFCRRLGIGLFKALNSLLTGQRVTDNTSGFRAYNRAALLFASENYPSFDYPEPEEVVLMAKNRFRITEVPIKMRCRQGGRSSISPVKSVYYMCKVLLAVWMTSLRPATRKKEM